MTSGGGAHVPSGPTWRARPVRAALAVLCLALAGYTATLLPGVRDAHHPYVPALDTWLADGIIAASALVVAARAALHRTERWVWWLFTASTGVYLGGEAYYRAVLVDLDPSAIPYPSWADAGWLLWYPFVYAALLVLLRSRLHRVRAGVWLDGLSAGAGAAALAGALLLRPVLSLGEDALWAAVTTLAYPVADLALLTLIVLVLNLNGWRLQATWLLLGAGLAVLFAADTAYTLQVSSGGYTDATVLDVLWPATFVCFALAAWSPQPPPAPVRETRTSVVVPAALSTAGTLVLFAGAVRALPVVVCATGLLAVLLATARLLLTLVEARRLAQARLEARTDELTGLGNRRSFVEALQGCLASATAPRGVLLIDLDGFKKVNDSLGHGVGDELLKVVGHRLRTRAPAATVHAARLGGDEFAVLVDGSCEHVLAVARAVRELLGEPMELAGLVLSLDASVGVTHAEADDPGWEAVLSRADMAMYAAKRARTGVEVYTEGRDEDGIAAAAMLAELRGALGTEALHLHYQPQVDLADGSVRSVEALLRWHHPVRGLLAPGSFLPVAVEAGLSRSLTDHVLALATAQVAAWRAQGLPVAVAVNLTQADVRDPALPERVLDAVRRHDLDPAAVVLEVTEDVVGAEDPGVVARLGLLRRLGFRLSMDDFGTGQSSLSYLRHLPLDEVKLDRAFMTGLLTDASAVTVVQGTIDIAHGLGLGIVAEGVEDGRTLDLLRDLGCDVVQGYHLCRPAPAADVTAFLAGRPPVPAPRRPSAQEPVSSPRT